MASWTPEQYILIITTAGSSITAMAVAIINAIKQSNNQRQTQVALTAAKQQLVETTEKVDATQKDIQETKDELKTNTAITAATADAALKTEDKINGHVQKLQYLIQDLTERNLKYQDHFQKASDLLTTIQRSRQGVIPEPEAVDIDKTLREIRDTLGEKG